MNILNKNVQELANRISITLDKVRLAAYAGVIYGYIEVNRESVKNTNLNDIKVKLYDLYYELNEVAIIDKDMFLDISNKFIKYYQEPMVNSNMINSLNDALGLTTVFGQATMDAINDNISTFRDTRKLFKDCLNK
jgi:hypothetical protein